MKEKEKKNGEDGSLHRPHSTFSPDISGARFFPSHLWSCILEDLHSSTPFTMGSGAVDIAPAGSDAFTRDPAEDLKAKAAQPPDAFGDEEFAEVKYKTLTWWFVLPCQSLDISTVLMSDEIGREGC